MLFLTLLLACSAEDSVAPGIGVCGDGTVDADEACDDGDANSDEAPDACRVPCVLAACGDGVIDGGEACDDGETWGGDGCDASCDAETGTLEQEPNDSWDDANAGTTVDGALPAGDLDCWTFPVDECGAIDVIEQAPCTGALTLTLHDPDGAGLASGAIDGEGCAHLDPTEEPGARWVQGGDWSVCVGAVDEREVRGYHLAITTPDPVSIGADPIGGDLDADAIPDSCDADIDGDGLGNDDDTCPDVSNGPDTPALALATDGFVVDWLAIGPYTTGTSTVDCRPSEDVFVGEDAPLDATIGTEVGELVWTAQFLTSGDFNLLGFASVDAPREAYTLVYLRSDTARTLTLAVGADDGVFAWWNGALVLDVSSCQGITADQFQASVSVEAGWNTLLTKVRDAGGGWDVGARFYDDGGALVTDLEPSLVPGTTWKPDQTDGDGDGVGDVCDDTP